MTPRLLSTLTAPDLDALPPGAELVDTSDPVGHRDGFTFTKLPSGRWHSRVLGSWPSDLLLLCWKHRPYTLTDPTPGSPS